MGYRFLLTHVDPAYSDHVERLFDGLPRVDRAAAETVGPVDAGSAQQLQELMSRINLAAISASAGSLLLHAGAVARSDGGVAVLSGRSGTGKTTLTVGLADSGLAYVTDEAVCLDPGTLRITPFRKPAVVKPGAQHLFPHLRPRLVAGGAWLVPPAALGGPPLPRHPLQPRLLVFPTYIRGAACDVVPLSEAEAAYELGANSSRLHEVRGDALPALARLARRARAYRVVFDDLDRASRAVHELLRSA